MRFKKAAVVIYRILHGPVVESAVAPNSYFELNCKHNLEASTIQTAPFAAVFLKIVLDFQKWQNAPFRANILGMVTNDLLWNVSTDTVAHSLYIAKSHLMAILLLNRVITWTS